MSTKLQVEVDQSVKVEELNRDTVIGVASKDEDIAYILPRKTKRFFNEIFRKNGEPRKCAPTVFVAAVIATLRARKWKPSRIVIDSEYEGYEELIISLLEKHFPGAVIQIKRIGRSSSAHRTAYNTHLGNRKPDGVVTRRAVAGVLLNKKTAAGPHRLGLTRVRKPKRPV